MALVGSNGLTNGHASTSAHSTNNGNGSSNGVVKKPMLKRPLGGITVTTVKRAPPPPVRSTSSSTNATAAKRPLNALPEDVRQRVEQQRKESERKKREEIERNRPKRAPDQDARRAQEASRKKKQKRATREASDSDSDDDLFGDGGAVKAKKAARMKRSASAEESSSCYKRLGRSGVQSHYQVPRDVLDPNAFSTSSAEPIHHELAIQSAQLLQGKVVGPFFHGLEGETRVRLEYPADGASEEFILQVPKERDEYDPISDLLRTVRCIVEFYLTEDQQALFGRLEDFGMSSTAGNILLQGHDSATLLDRRAHSPLSTARNSREGTPATGVPSIESMLAGKVASPMPASPMRSTALANGTAASSPAPTGPGDADTESILRSFVKARNRRDGPLFVRTVERFNDALRQLKENGQIRRNVEAMAQTGVSEGIWRCIQEQCYARTVAPRVEELSKYEAFSDNVYGELLPRFMSEIAQLTQMGPHSVFVDLGSGVGNLLIQAALQTGSQSYGCEMMTHPSELADVQVAEAKRRWRMWGLRGALCEAWCGDFGEDERARDVLRRADVVLVNNYAFTARTNDKLSLQFLDLKDGAHVVSLKPFVPSDFRLTGRTLSSPLAILRVAERHYTTGCVSWADGGGKYYIHTVDRSLVARYLEQHGDMVKTTQGERRRQWKAIPEESDEE